MVSLTRPIVNVCAERIRWLRSGSKPSETLGRGLLVADDLRTRRGVPVVREMSSVWNFLLFDVFYVLLMTNNAMPYFIFRRVGASKGTRILPRHVVKLLIPTGQSRWPLCWRRADH